MSDPVLIHTANAIKAGQRWGIPPSVILGILSVEGGTSASGKPVAPGDGAGPPSYAQATFGTGATYHVQYGNSASETDFIGHYLHDLGYDTDPTRAIAAYNGGPGNPQYSYASKVLAAAKHYTGLGAGDTTTPTSSSSTAPATTDTTSDTSSDSGGGLFGATERSGAVRALLYVSLAAGGVALAGLGIFRTTGLRGGVTA